MEYNSINEALVSHMKRYVWIWETLQTMPDNPTNGDVANGHAELGAEIAEIEALLKQLAEGKLSQRNNRNPAGST